MEVVAGLLSQAGLALRWVPWREGRPNAIATWRGGGPVTLAAHLDTVPFDRAAWTTDPLGGEIIEGRLFGRGASDMKAAAAAMVTAAIRAALEDAPPFTLVFTSAEEIGCRGAREVAASGLLAPNPVLIIGEATDNRLLLGHKGATWLEVTARGRSAHGSRPDLGENAIVRLTDAIAALSLIQSPPPHRILGGRTVNVGTIRGGQQTNLVPAWAVMTVDVRTTPGADAADVVRVLESASGGEVTRLLDVPSVWTDPSSRTSTTVGRIIEGVTGTPSPLAAASYFTDGAVLAGPATPSVFIVGPGAVDQPHTSDESVDVKRIAESERIYEALLVGLA